MNKWMITLFKAISILAGCTTAFLWFLMLVGLVLARHVDNTGEVLGRVKLFAAYSVCSLVVGIVFECIIENAQEKI